jgi:hypothetical protein
MKMYKLAKVLRSKNAGPFRTTLDILFDADEPYRRVRDSGVLTREYIAQLYGIEKKDVYGIFHADAVRGIKITINKPAGMASGDIHCRDLFGGQQHIPLLSIEVP